MGLEKRFEAEDNENSISRYLKYSLIAGGVYFVGVMIYESIDSTSRIVDSLSNYLN